MLSWGVKPYGDTHISDIPPQRPHLCCPIPDLCILSPLII